MLLDYLPIILPTSDPTRGNLSLLGGFAFGVLAQECVENDEWVQKPFVYIQKYLNIVQQLDQQECNQLAGALSEVFVKFTKERHDG